MKDSIIVHLGTRFIRIRKPKKMKQKHFQFFINNLSVIGVRGWYTDDRKPFEALSFNYDNVEDQLGEFCQMKPDPK